MMIIKYRNVRWDDTEQNRLYFQYTVFFSPLVFLYILSLNLLWKKLFFFSFPYSSALSYRVIVIRCIPNTYLHLHNIYWKLNFCNNSNPMKKKKKKTKNVFSTEDYSNISIRYIESCWGILFYFFFLILLQCFNIFYSYESGLVLWFEWTIRDYIMGGKDFSCFIAIYEI